MSVVCLGGGIGATRLWRPLAAEIGQESLTVVVNTADDLWHYGLRVSPDIDTVIYGLSDAQDQGRGWGLRDETFAAMEMLRELGDDAWFNLGDRDLATHLLRTKLLGDNWSYTRVTRHLASARGISARVLPMCDTEVATEVLEHQGDWVRFQQFHVMHRARPTVDRVRYAGIEDAVTPPEVLEAIYSASLIILGPSSPVASVLPILGVGSTRAALRRSDATIVGVSPIVSGSPITDAGDAHRARCREHLMAAQGIAHQAWAVAELYADLLDFFVLDEADASECSRVASFGIEPVIAPTLMHLHDSAADQMTSTILGLRSAGNMQSPQEVTSGC